MIFDCRTPFPRKDRCPHRGQQGYAGGHHHVCNNRARLLRRDPAKREARAALAPIVRVPNGAPDKTTDGVPVKVLLSTIDGQKLTKAAALVPASARPRGRKRSVSRDWPEAVNHRSLPGPLVTDRHDPIFQDACLEPFLDQAGDASVADAMLHKLDEPLLAYRVERRHDRLPITKTIQIRLSVCPKLPIP